MKLGIKSAILFKKGLIVNLFTKKKYIRTKMKSYEGKIDTHFHEDKMPKESSQ